MNTVCFDLNSLQLAAMVGIETALRAQVAQYERQHGDARDMLNHVSYLIRKREDTLLGIGTKE